MVTAKKAIVTPGNIFAEGVMKATKDVRAGNFVYGTGISAEGKGVVSKGLIRGMKDIKAENLILGVKGVRSNVDVIADNKVIAKKHLETATMTVKKGGKFLSTLDVNGHATFGSATIKGKLYVGKRAIGDIVTSMETDMAKMRSEMMEVKQNLRQALMMLDKQQK